MGIRPSVIASQRQMPCYVAVPGLQAAFMYGFMCIRVNMYGTTVTPARYVMHNGKAGEVRDA